MNSQRNYNTYLNGMTKGNNEKLFFLNKINLEDYETVIDFGCGGGDILHAVSQANSNLKLIGIDLDDYMRKITKEKTPSCEVYASLKREMLNEKTLIIFNSVLHEVEGYWSTLREIISKTGATVVVRDMRFDWTQIDLIDKEDLAKLVDKSSHFHLASFIAKYGITTNKDLIHYLLKYSYVDNWDLELAENYFSFNWEELLGLGEVKFENFYTLDFKKTQVKKHFSIDLNLPTHCQLILKLK